MSKTFTNGGYSVTVHDDRSIQVKPNDWISKYAMAIYGDPMSNWDKFKRKRGNAYIDLDNPNVIHVGETLYHPDPLPGESLIPPGESDPGSKPPLKAKYAADFLKWIHQRFLTTDWEVGDTGGGDLSLTFLTGQYATINIVKKSVAVKTKFHAFATGLTIGWPSEGFTAGGSFSTTDFWSAGTILRAPYRQQLTLDDFRHGIIVLEFGANFYFFVGGAALTLVLFGIAAPILVIQEIERFFRSGNLNRLQAAFQKVAPAGLAVLGGPTIGIPGASVAGRLGFMYDRFDRRNWGL